MEETDRLLDCTFCRIRLFIVSTGPFHYYIPAAAADNLIYMPYWRIRGLAYTIGPMETTNRYLDTNLKAIPLKVLTPSLGVRPQAMKLRFLTPDTPGQFLRPTMKAEEVLPQGSPSTGLQSRDIFIGDTVSLIYTPMILKNDTLYDAFVQRPVVPWTDDDRKMYPALNPSERDHTRFIATLCPHCGQDLQGTKDTLLMTCKNCQSMWSCEGASLQSIPFAAMVGSGTPLRYLPFWRMKLRFDGIPLVSLADLVRIANLPKPITPAMEEKQVFLWAPAFKINPALFLRWARQITIYQPDDDCLEAIPTQLVYPATLPLKEAVESVTITLGSIVTDKRMFFANLSRLHMNLEDSLLVYQPFVEKGRELIHEKMKVALDRNALTFGACM
ncbi:MAG: hypothetical protein M0P16_02990 [Syntrophales bacterium]|nr:hypothetical protein [Syntrophales bacterium]